jgi:hypothetical protein
MTIPAAPGTNDAAADAAADALAEATAVANTATDAAVDEIVRRGPAGAFAVAGIATALVMAMFFAFYCLVYLPRGAVQ